MKCQKCDYDNLKGVCKCGKCGTILKNSYKSCPKCATKNDFEATKCQKCGYKFAGNSLKRTIISLSLSVLLMALLLGYLLIDKNKANTLIHLTLQILSILIILFVVINSFVFGKKNEIVPKDAEHSITNSNIQKLKIISRFFLILFCFIILGIVIFIYVKYFH